MRKSISVSESMINESGIKKKCVLVEKLLKELNTMSRKVSLIKADDEMGDADPSKLGRLDELALSLENTINLLAKL